MNKLRDLINDIYDGINKLTEEYDEELYQEVHCKLLELSDMIDNNKIPNELYVNVKLFHHKERLIHASLKTNNKGK